MALSDVQLVVLQTELDTDPKTLGYNTDDPYCASLLNTLGLSNETIFVGVIDGQELSKAVVISEYTALSDAERQGWTTMLAAGDGQVDIDDQRVLDQATAIWAGTTTLSNLNALRTRNASRAEVLFGRDVSVTHLDVARARVI